MTHVNCSLKQEAPGGCIARAPKEAYVYNSITTATSKPPAPQPDEWTHPERPCCHIVRGSDNEPLPYCEKGEHANATIIARWAAPRMRDYCKEGARLSDADLRLIVTSAISAKVAKERGYRTITTKAELKRSYSFSGSQLLTPTLLIPLWSPNGKCVGWQHRPDEPRINPKTGKPIKYETPAKSRTAIDVHPSLSRTRTKQNDEPYLDTTELPSLIADPTVPLIITEGVRKGDSAVSIGLCCIALPGVWNWRGANAAGGKVAHPDWEFIALDGRSVYVVFDSDVMVNRKVAAALSRLKAFLESRKANVKLIYLPAGTHGEKVGLDDFIASQKAGEKSDAEIRSAILAMATDELRQIKDPNEDDDERPSITLQPGQFPRIVDRAEAVLVKNAESLKIFQRSTDVVRIISLSRQDVERAEKRDHIRRPEGALVLHPVCIAALTETFDRLISWQRYNKDGELVPADCPSKIANTYLSRVGFWKLPYLTGVIEAPILRRDGSVLSESGYDPKTGLFLTSDEAWLPVPENPTIEDAKKAAETLMAPFAQFPFSDDIGSDRSVHLAAILTALQRRLLESAPLFAYTARVQRSGKSMLAESVGLIATGRRPPAMAVAREDAELRKAITSVLREGHLITHLDNITHVLDSPDLAKAITQSSYRDRILGVSATATLLTNMLWTATGNNFTVKGDLSSRTLLCSIDPQMERPEERVFKIANLPAYLLEHQKELVAAALTVLYAYHVAGRPRQNVKPWGGFDQWSREIREPIVWLGLADPCKTREQVIVNDPDRELNGEVFCQWHKAFGDTPKLTRDVLDKAEEEEFYELKRALLKIASEKDSPGKIDPRRFAAWCRKVEGGIIDGLRLGRGREIQHAREWSVSRVSGVSSGQADPNGVSDAHGAQKGRSEPPEPPEAPHASRSCPSDRPKFNSPDSPDSPDGADIGPTGPTKSEPAGQQVGCPDLDALREAEIDRLAAADAGDAPNDEDCET